MLGEHPPLEIDDPQAARPLGDQHAAIRQEGDRQSAVSSLALKLRSMFKGQVICNISRGEWSRVIFHYDRRLIGWLIDT